MLLRCYNAIQVTQVPTTDYPQRNSSIMLSFLNKYEITDGWENLTTSARVVIPKQVTVIDANTQQPITLQGTNKNIGGQSNPLFLKGDQVVISAGYWYNDIHGVEQQNAPQLFSGYITRVTSKTDITLECENNMWLLKQIPVPNQSWDNISLQSILEQCLEASKVAYDAGITVDTQMQSSFSINTGTLTTHNLSLAQLLAKFKREMGLEAYFRGSTLRVGYSVYYDSDVTVDDNGTPDPYQFIFQQNIISDNLAYQRKDDIVMSAIGTAMVPGPSPGSTKDSNAITRKKQLMVYAWCDQASQTIMSKVITDDPQIPAGTEGQRFEYNYPDCPNITELTNRVTAKLSLAYYTGFTGDFTTFGMPVIRVGDNIGIQDLVLPDRNGTYKVKMVEYSGGYGIGIRQKIHLDYLIQ